VELVLIRSRKAGYVRGEGAKIVQAMVDDVVDPFPIDAVVGMDGEVTKSDCFIHG
jgi:hypothetical protein